MNDGDLFKIGRELTAQLKAPPEGPMWKVEDNDLEVWAGKRYFVVCRVGPTTFIVTEEQEEDLGFMLDRKVWDDWTDAAHDVITRILGPRK